MAKRDTSSYRQRARKQPGGRASSRVPPRARAQAQAQAQAREASQEALSAQAQLLQNVQQIWLAGMGAIARAQRDGPSAFSDAVLEGLRLLNQSRSTAQQMVRDVFGSAQETLQSRVGGARDQAQGTWDNLESLFQTRVQRAMHQLGVPTAEEIRVLTRRVAELNENVKRVNARERVRQVASAKKRAAPRTRKRAGPTRGAE